MLSNLINIESFIALSVGAIFSYKVNKINFSFKKNIRINSPDINGGNNVIIYNEAMQKVNSEMAFLVKVCAVVMLVFFHFFPLFFSHVLSALSISLPLLCLLGVVNSIRSHGMSRYGDSLYFLASCVMGVLCYCGAKAIEANSEVYPQLSLLIDSVSAAFSRYGFMGVLGLNQTIRYLVFILFSSFACPALILSSFYLAFAYVMERNANDAFRYSCYVLAVGYVSYVFLTGALFSSGGDLSFLLKVLTYPLSTIASLFSF